MGTRGCPLEGVDVSRFWAGRRVLVTGHTGFKGAWLAFWLERLGAEVTGVALPPESPDGAFAALGPCSGMRSRVIDVRDPVTVRRVVDDVAPEVVFHLAAQAVVGRGWSDPGLTYATNVVGTSNVLEAVAGSGSAPALVVVTSDKVYANGGGGPCFTEDSPLGGRDPYSASKAAAELVVAAWREGNPRARVATARAGNVIGGGDMAEDRLLPDAWRAVRARAPLALRNPRATRPWQFVLEPLAGYLLVAERLAADADPCPSAINFGPDPSACWPVADVVDRAFELWGSGCWHPDLVDHPPESTTLALDASLATASLGWRPRLEPADAIRWTVEWWRAAASGRDLRELAARQLATYEALVT